MVRKFTAELINGWLMAEGSARKTGQLDVQPAHVRTRQHSASLRCFLQQVAIMRQSDGCVPRLHHCIHWNNIHCPVQRIHAPNIRTAYKMRCIFKVTYTNSLVYIIPYKQSSDNGSHKGIRVAGVRLHSFSTPALDDKWAT